jgi:hypothetical protein
MFSVTEFEHCKSTGYTWVHCRYELVFSLRDYFDTTRSIWTFVTNQRRILGDNATENSRSEAHLLVVKFRRGCSPYLYKRDTTK